MKEISKTRQGEILNIPIIDVIKNHEDINDYIKLKKHKSGNHIGFCHYHRGREMYYEIVGKNGDVTKCTGENASFTVSSKLNIYKCFGCGKGGNVVQLVMDLYKIDSDKAMDYLDENY